jgi:hypothetical protein
MMIMISSYADAARRTCGATTRYIKMKTLRRKKSFLILPSKPFFYSLVLFSVAAKERLTHELLNDKVPQGSRLSKDTELVTGLLQKQRTGHNESCV